MHTHEDLSRAHQVKGGSDRSFGLVFSIVFCLLGVWPVFHHRPVRIGWLAASLGVLLIAFAKPRLLAPFNRWWTRLGALLNRVINPVVSGILFYLVVTPIGVLMRWSGSDPLRVRLDPRAETYWIRRDPPGPEPPSMIHQF